MPYGKVTEVYLCDTCLDEGRVFMECPASEFNGGDCRQGTIPAVHGVGRSIVEGVEQCPRCEGEGTVETICPECCGNPQIREGEEVG